MDVLRKTFRLGKKSKEKERNAKNAKIELIGSSLVQTEGYSCQINNPSTVPQAQRVNFLTSQPQTQSINSGATQTHPPPQRISSGSSQTQEKPKVNLLESKESNDLVILSHPPSYGSSNSRPPPGANMLSTDASAPRVAKKPENPLIPALKRQSLTTARGRGRENSSSEAERKSSESPSFGKEEKTRNVVRISTPTSRSSSDNVSQSHVKVGWRTAESQRQQSAEQMEKSLATVTKRYERKKAKFEKLWQENENLREEVKKLRETCNNCYICVNKDNRTALEKVRQLDGGDGPLMAAEIIKKLERKHSWLINESRKQNETFNRCLDDIYKEIALAFQSQKDLKDTCCKLQDKVDLLEKQNEKLQRQLKYRSPKLNHQDAPFYQQNAPMKDPRFPNFSNPRLSRDSDLLTSSIISHTSDSALLHPQPPPGPPTSIQTLIDHSVMSDRFHSDQITSSNHVTPYSYNERRGLRTESSERERKGKIDSLNIPRDDADNMGKESRELIENNSEEDELPSKRSTISLNDVLDCSTIGPSLNTNYHFSECEQDELALQRLSRHGVQNHDLNTEMQTTDATKRSNTTSPLTSQNQCETHRTKTDKCSLVDLDNDRFSSVSISKEKPFYSKEETYSAAETFTSLFQHVFKQTASSNTDTDTRNKENEEFTINNLKVLLRDSIKDPPKMNDTRFQTDTTKILNSLEDCKIDQNFSKGNTENQKEPRNIDEGYYTNTSATSTSVTELTPDLEKRPNLFQKDRKNQTDEQEVNKTASIQREENLNKQHKEQDTAETEQTVKSTSKKLPEIITSNEKTIPSDQSSNPASPIAKTSSGGELDFSKLMRSMKAQLRKDKAKKISKEMVAALTIYFEEMSGNSEQESHTNFNRWLMKQASSSEDREDEEICISAFPDTEITAETHPDPTPLNADSRHHKDGKCLTDIKHQAKKNHKGESRVKPSNPVKASPDKLVTSKERIDSNQNYDDSLRKISIDESNPDSSEPSRHDTSIESVDDKTEVKEETYVLSTKDFYKPEMCLNSARIIHRHKDKKHKKSTAELDSVSLNKLPTKEITIGLSEALVSASDTKPTTLEAENECKTYYHGFIAKKKSHPRCLTHDIRYHDIQPITFQTRHRSLSGGFDTLCPETSQENLKKQVNATGSFITPVATKHGDYFTKNLPAKITTDLDIENIIASLDSILITSKRTDSRFVPTHSNDCHGSRTPETKVVTSDQSLDRRGDGVANRSDFRSRKLSLEDIYFKPIHTSETTLNNSGEKRRVAKVHRKRSAGKHKRNSLPPKISGRNEETPPLMCYNCYDFNGNRSKRKPEQETTTQHNHPFAYKTDIQDLSRDACYENHYTGYNNSKYDYSAAWYEHETSAMQENIDGITDIAKNRSEFVAEESISVQETDQHLEWSESKDSMRIFDEIEAQMIELNETFNELQQHSEQHNKLQQHSEQHNKLQQHSEQHDSYLLQQTEFRDCYNKYQF